MELGNKILELRKKHNLSQEQLAFKMNITRQTISKWELGETSPDIRQGKELANIFNVSLDELVDNDIKNVQTEKISNTEKLAGLIIKILKFIGIGFLGLLIIDIIAFIVFNAVRMDVSSSSIDEITINCSLNNSDYLITVGSDAYFNCSNCDKKMQKDITSLIDYSNIKGSISEIETYFNNKQGICE